VTDGQTGDRQLTELGRLTACYALLKTTTNRPYTKPNRIGQEKALEAKRKPAIMLTEDRKQLSYYTGMLLSAESLH